MGKRIIPAVVLLGLLEALTGCQADPRVVVGDLPGDSIFDAALAPAGRGPQARQFAPGDHSQRPALARQWLPSAHERPWQYIVIHHSASPAGSAEVFDRAHRARGFDELGYHFVIDNGRGGPDGLVEVGPRWTKQKWGAHTGGTPDNAYNNYGIGICLVGDFSAASPSPAQLASLGKLVALLAERYQIDASRIIGHRDAPGADTACPGARLYRYLYDVLRPELPRRR